jgi:hypothetical protein
MNIRLIALFCSLMLSCSGFAQTVQITVDAKEQIGKIAQRYLIAPATAHWAELIKLNKLKDPYIIQPGQTLLLPTRLLAKQLSDAKWQSVSGDVRVFRAVTSAAQGVPVQVGDTFQETDRVAVAKDASAVLVLSDGSQVKLLSETELVLDEHHYLRGRPNLKQPQTAATGTKAFAGLLRLIQGSVETMATSAGDRAKPLRIQTPTSVVGVRGTEFRVSHGASIGDTETRAEVVEGLVLAQLDEQRKAQVSGGYGIKLDSKLATLPTPVALQEAPNLSSWQLLQERPVMTFAPLQQQGNAAIPFYRVQVAASAQAASSSASGSDAFANIVFDRRFAATDALRIPGLPDGSWLLRVRAIDGAGIEGKNAQTTVVLKARPEPALIQQPRQDAKFTQSQNVQLGWARVAGAASYRVMLVNEETQQTTRHEVTDATLLAKDLAVGRYKWRLATQIKTSSGATDTGPWSDPQHFAVVATPEAAKGAFDPGAKALSVRWADQAAASYEVQHTTALSFDDARTQPTLIKTDKNEVTIANPQSGPHLLRYRAIEKDGFVGDWSPAMGLDIPAPKWPIWTTVGLFLYILL